ncbi:unnamed protein product [Clavelina lepadiformis]|uniref:PLAT domain-containing protein n=1 Tax=Clavelina lepadiformis TaxID=159417 RepID=A0ABP0GAK7_CLALP
MVLRNVSGKIVFPATEECDNNTVLPDIREWEISLREGEFAYLQFDESSLNCLHGILIIKKSSGKQNSFICEPDKPGNYLFKEDFEISMERFTVNCSLAHISFSYFRFDFHLTMSNRHIQLGQSVRVTAKLTGADGWQEPLNCSLEYDGMFAQTLISMSTSIFAAKHFRYPKSYLIYARCGIHEGSEAFETPKTYLYAECGLSHSSLRVFHKELSLVYLNQVEILFHHRYCFPISYSLLLNDVIIAQNQTQQVFSKTKFLSQVFEEVNFNINSSSQQLTGSGIHDVTLLLQNNVSSVLYPTTVTFNEEIKDFKVTVKEYVGFHPHYFIINATVSHGAPINLTIEIKSVKSNFSHFNNSLFCPRLCHSMVAEATLSLPGMYKVEAIATNSVSLSSSSLAQFEALPQIYNVYISSLKPIPSYSRNYVYAFVRGDIGDYMMTIYLQGRPENHSFTISKLEYDHKDLPSLPFDAKFYKLIKVERVLYHIGMQQVTGFIRNSKQSFPFVGWVDVLETSSCLENLRIRDGNYLGGFEKPLKVFDYLTFSVDFKFTCKNMSEVRYKWLVFPVATDLDMATYTYEVEYEKESFEPELIIRADTLSPGLYVIKVKVTSENVTSDVLEGKLKDYTLIEIPMKKLHFVILGGNVLQTDNNMTVLRFESSVDHNKYHQHINYNWFCSIKQEELPTRTVMGKIQRKDSCFDWHTLWVTSGHVMEISMNELRQSEHYYIRLIISGPHYDATYADQKVVVQARPAPIVNLKCWSNCEKYFSPHLSIILQLECDDCLRRKWTLSPNPGHQLPLCEDQEFCKLNASLLILSSNVTGTGYNIHGENSSVTIFLNALSSHGGGSCIVLPRMGSAYTTKFNVTCAGYIEGKYQLMYKFFLQEKGHRYLLQYGFDPVLYDIILPPGRSSNDVTIVIEICTPDQSCVEENLSVTVVDNYDVNDDVINELDAAFLSNNLQKIAQFVLVLSSTNKLNQSKRKEIISKMAKYPMLSLEPVKQVADVISHVTNNPKLLEESQLQDVQDILDRVESFVPFSASRYDDVNSIVRSCMTTTSQLMRLVRFYPFKNEENLRMNRLGKLLMASLTPGEVAISFETKSVEGRMIKLNNHFMNLFDTNTSFVQLSNLQSLITDDVINIEIFRYNSTSANFSPFDLKVDSVTSVSITTGWRDELPISKEIAKNLKLEFSLPQQPDKSKIWLRVKSECDGSACRSTAIGSAFINVEGDSSGAMEATILNIVVGNIEGRVKKLKMFLTLVGQVITMARKEFDKEATHYRWITKAPFVGFGSYNVTIRADLGPGYYRAGTITSAVFSVWALQCLHWFDAKNGWEDSLCKAHEDTVSGTVVCQCGHYPVTRVVWTQGHKRSTDEFTRAPSLLASKLLVFPNKLDYNEISSNMWQRFLENPVVLSMLFVLYFLYGLGLIWARSKDRQVEAEDLCVEVPDNSPFDKYRYIVTVFTGSRRNSGTSAVVCLRLVGNMATSSAHVIQHHTKILNRGSVKSFLITTSDCLGDITAIRLWHDNGGHSPEWFLQRVVVRDLEKNNCWFFLCNRWFKHVIDHVVPAARTKDLHNTRTLFPLRLENHLRDRYLWYAFYGMRPWQRHVMGRIEMLSCFLMITLMIMLTALMFHGNNHAQQGLLLAVGNYTFQWWHVAVGIESALLSSPATFLITTMFRRSQRPHKSLLTDSKSVDDEESNVNDEQNPVSHHPNVADGSKEENLKLELFHEQLPVDNKTHLRVKPNRETSFVEVAETSQHVMSEDRRVHHHQRKEATGKMNQKEKRKLKKESPKTEHHDESKIHHRLKPYGKSRAFEVAGTSQQVLNEEHRVHHHRRKESNNELDQKERRKLNKESPEKDHRDESKILSKVKHHGEAPAIEVADTSRHVLSEERRVNHHQHKGESDEINRKPRQKLVKEFPKKQHRGESKSPKSHQGVKPHGENPPFKVADTSRHVLIEDRRVNHHQRKEANDKMDKKERRKLKNESPKKDHRGERKSHRGVKPHGESPVNTVAHTSQRVLNEKHQVIHHQNKQTNDELDQKERLKWMIELLLHEPHHDENKIQLGAKAHGKNPAIEVADTSRHLLSEDGRVHHHQRKKTTENMDPKERRKLKEESLKKQRRGESKNPGVKPHGETPANTVAHNSQRVLNEKHQVIHHQNKEMNDELDQKERLKWMVELLLHKDHHDENKSHQGVKPHGENPANTVAHTSQRLLSEKHQVHHHQRKELNDELDQKERRKLKKESPKKDHQGESKILPRVKHHGEAPAIEVADTSRNVLSEERRVKHHQRKEASDEMDRKPRLKLVKEFPKKQYRGESKSHQGVKPHGENPAFEVAEISRHDLIEDRRVYHHQRKEANDKMDKRERRKLKKEFLNKHHRGESHDFRRKSHQTGKRGHKHSIIVTKTARHVSSEGHSKHDAISQPQPSSGRVRFEEESSDDLKPPMRKIFLSSIVCDKDQPSTSSAAFVTSLSMPLRSPSIAMTSSQEPSTSSQEPSTSSFVGMTSSQEPSTSSFVTEQVTPSARSHFAGQRVAVSGTGAHRGIAFVENDPNTGDSRVLPHFFIYIAWILLVATVLTSTVLCALYGMSYGIETCKEWLVSVSVAFLQSVIILEPLKEVLIAYVKVVNNPKLDLRDWIPPLPPSVTPRSHSGDCDAIKRRQDEERSRNRIYRPPSQLRLEITLQDIEEKIRTKRKIKNISLHLIFLVLLFIVTFGQTERNSFQFGKTVQNMLLDGHRKMSSANDVYNWVEFSLADKFSIGRLTHFPDNQLLIVTPPTLRQKRVIKGTSCVHSDSAFKYGLSDTNQCKLHYENQFQEKRTHGPTWSRPPTHATKPSHDVYESCWEYSTANTSWLSSYIGDLALFYNPGGYYVTISKLANETRDQVHYLRRFCWIDGYTRFLMLETVLYNVPHRIYYVTMVAIEISNTGNYVVKPQLMFMRSHHVESAWDVAVQVALYGILVLVLYHLVEVASGFLEEGFRFLKNLWNVLLLFILTTSTLAVGLYLSRVTYTDQAFQAYRNNMKSFHLYHMAAFTDYLTKCLLSICTFFTMLYTVKVMEGHPIFDLMHATIHRAKLEVLGLSLYIFFLYIAFCHVGLVLFGRSKDFSSVSKAMQSVVGFSMEAFTSTNLLRAYPIRESIFLLLILFIFIKIFVNFFAAVLENTFRELKLLRRERLTRQHLMSFGRKHIRTVFTIRDEISERFRKVRSKRKVE